MLTQIEMDVIQLSPTAVQAVRDLFAQRNLEDEYAFRVYVAGRSCSGLQYGMALDNKPNETDISSITDGIKVLVDDISIQYLRGATIDFVEDERGKGFVVNNPNIEPACACEGGSCG